MGFGPGGDPRHANRLRSTLNGRWDRMDPDVQLAFTLLTQELDQVHSAIRSMRNVVLWVGTTIASGIVGLTLTLLSRL